MRHDWTTVGRQMISAKMKPVAAVSVAAIGLVLMVISVGHGVERTTPDQPEWIGKPAPDFALANLSGQTVHLSDFKGKAVLLDFWATWCVPCVEEIPNLVQLQRQYASKGFTVLGVAMDDEGSAVVKPVVQKFQVNYPIVIGSSEVAASYGGIEGVPTTFLIGRDGKVLKVYFGARDKREFQKDIEAALSRGGKAAK